MSATRVLTCPVCHLPSHASKTNTVGVHAACYDAIPVERLARRTGIIVDTTKLAGKHSLVIRQPGPGLSWDAVFAKAMEEPA